jgi:hypothetical protein
LNRRFGVVPDYVCRVFYSDDGERLSSHAWLELDGLILDISGDQFGWPGVIVTRNSSLHERGADEERHRWALDPRWWGSTAAEYGGLRKPSCPARLRQAPRDSFPFEYAFGHDTNVPLAQ